MLAKTIAVITALSSMIILGSLAMTTPLNLDSLNQSNNDLGWLDSSQDPDNIGFSNVDDSITFGPFTDDGSDLTDEVTVQPSTYSFYQPTTKLKISKTATGFFERSVNYDWSVSKSASPDQLTIKKGGPAGTVWFTIVATRTKISDTSIFGVYGNICVTNTGSSDTKNLKIVDKIQYQSLSGYSDSTHAYRYSGYGTYYLHHTQYHHDGYFDMPGSATFIDTSSNPILSPGERVCYPYVVKFTQQEMNDSNLYRNVAMVSITNYQGHAGYRYGPMPAAASFTIPSTPSSVKYYDEHAKLFDLESCPKTFNCYLQNKGQGVGPWLLIGTDDSTPGSYDDFDSSETITMSYYGSGPFQESATIKFGERLLNSHAQCNTSVPLTNTATLIEIDSGQRHVSSDASQIWTGPCQLHY